MTIQSLKSNVINAQELFINRSYNTVKNHKLVSYIACSGYNTEHSYTQFILALSDGRSLLFRYKADYARAETLFISVAIKLLRYADSTGDLPVSVLSRMLVKATDRIE